MLKRRMTPFAEVTAWVVAPQRMKVATVRAELGAGCANALFLLNRKDHLIDQVA